MIALLEHKRFIFRFVCISVFAVGIFYTVNTARLAKEFFVTNDLRFSQTMSESLQSFVLDRSGKAPWTIHQELQESFPMVHSVAVHRVGLCKAQVSIKATDLVWNLGNSFVLAKDGGIYLAGCYSDSALQNLPYLSIKSRYESASDISDVCREFLLNMPEYMMADYSVTWHGANNIILVPRQNKRFKIKIRASYVPSKDTLQMAQQLLQKNRDDKNFRGALMADARFEKQIVIS